MKKQDAGLTIVSRSFPPQVSGSAILLSNILGEYSGRVNAIAGWSQYSKKDSAFEAPCPTDYPTISRWFPKIYDSFSWRFPEVACTLLKMSMVRQLKKQKANVVLGACPSPYFLVASYLASQELGLPFFVHMHDLWEEQTVPGSADGKFATKWEPIILNNARRVLCMTEAMQEHYLKKYGKQFDFLPHCITDKEYQQVEKVTKVQTSGNPRVLFVGRVDPAMNEDAIKTLGEAATLLPRNFEILFCTNATKASLEGSGINTSRINVTYVSREEVQRMQSESHVLIAPLSFDNCCREEVRTVFSTKLLEYLISGRPVLVFSPEDSFHSESARKNGWGHVVSENTPEALAKGIKRIVEDSAYADQLVQGAFEEAEKRQASRYAQKLLDWVKEVG